MPSEASIVFGTEAANEYAVTRHSKDGVDAKTDVIAEEVPIAMVYNGISHVVMLATPQDLEDFALGFSLTEGILDGPSDLYGVEIVPQVQGIELHLEVASSCFQRLKEARRNMTGRTGCGLCGSESLEQALRIPTLKVAQANVNIVNGDVINLAFANIRKQQKLQAITGATHASAWINLRGEVELVREDVGRHNALDKLLGAMAKAKQQRAGFVLTTSRASYEMVQKTASAGINMLAAISAPTGLAIRIAEQCNLTLVGFAREDSYVVYSHPENIS
ncbi:MAG TPA: formate dehydrogenase accessory sulfurtransferase FdhD [Methylotenera sp.]|nr:formate dehydrogenase accessory sulfurtransferase FdhD [Methylotenera sp.]